MVRTSVWMPLLSVRALPIAVHHGNADLRLVPAWGTQLKIYQCYDNLPQQQWFYTDDDHIAVEGGNTCMRNDQQVESWGCGDGPVEQQVWTV